MTTTSLYIRDDKQGLGKDKKRDDMSEYQHFKDERLHELAAQDRNIAQFVSFAPDGTQRYSRTLGNTANYTFDSTETAAEYLITNTTEHSVNVRSFDPSDPKSRPFNYGITSVDDVVALVGARQNDGLHTIINETIDIHDGGVSGVALGNVVEFAPHDTPRCVEQPGTARLSRSMGASVLKCVYGFAPELTSDPYQRTEFSIHPLRRGYRDQHTIIWETEPVDTAPHDVHVTWPNRFSELIGDKTYGLIIADQIGLHVPQTTVINRDIKPFTFGTPTGNTESWLRTAPRRQQPGLYTTTHGWTDPYALLHTEDPTGTEIASVLCQEGVQAIYSGACAMGVDNELIMEGKSGVGDSFMLGAATVDTLPEYVQNLVRDTYAQASHRLGPVRFEWVYDGTHLWVVQLHTGKSSSTADVIYPGCDTTAYVPYDTTEGIEGLRVLIAKHTPGVGIELHGNIGITSHFGDLLRKAEIPSKLVRS